MNKINQNEELYMQYNQCKCFEIFEKWEVRV